MMASRMELIECLVVVVALLKCAAATESQVGDSLGWAVPPNTSYYSTWAHEHKNVLPQLTAGALFAVLSTAVVSVLTFV
ncbi:hypothetical protein CJ030_MR0G024278 [Morella rubra]|uniref:CASP-like protein n=1 Tax=Morella rubra TaxID=262757 RepID=A0A6A1UHS2_9ROSI|nr:hypothetical protein CJ030_MR0G024278 [Morella rubra]